MNQLPSLKVMACLADVGFTNYIDLLVYKLLLNYQKFNKNIEIDTIQFQKRINKLCQKYSLSEITAKRALKRLAKMGVVEIVYDLGFQKYVVKVKSLHDLLSQEGFLETDVIDEKSPKERNCEQTEKRSLEQQQQVRDRQKQTEADQLLRANGFKYHKRYLPLIAGYGIEAIKDSIEYFKKSRLNNEIANPAGWLRQCLRFEWYLDKDTYAPLNMLEKLTQLTNEVIDKFGTLPSTVVDAMWRRQPKGFDEMLLDWKNNQT